MASIDLGELARKVVAEHIPLAEAKNLDLGVERAEACTLTGDEESLRVMAANLIDNAIRYTPAGGRINVAVYRQQDRGILEVVDNGPGIPAGERERVFDRFYRRHGGDGEGSGLGLAIVRNVAERHQASVRLDDALQERGLAARVSFPIH
jgi:two-component system, OmpR family, sensor kinase